MNRSIFFESPFCIHMRPASEVAKFVDRFDAVVTFYKGGSFASASSVLDLMSLDIDEGDNLRITAVGHEAEQVLDSLCIMLLTLCHKGLPSKKSPSHCGVEFAAA